MLGIDPEQLWVTVYETDDEAETIWRDAVGVRPERIQRLGDDNFWNMGHTGPCGPRSEIFIDRARPTGATGGRPSADRSGSSRSGTWSSCSTTARRRRHGATAPPEHRHRRGPRAHPPADPGSRLAVRHRPLRPHAPHGPVDHRSHYGARRGHRRRTPDHGRPRAGHVHAGGRRRAALQRGPGLRPAPHHPPGRAPGPPARRGPGVHRAAGGRRRRSARGRPPGPGRAAPPDRRRGRARGGGLPAHARHGLDHPRGGTGLRGAPPCRARWPSGSTTPTGSRWN